MPEIGIWNIESYRYLDDYLKESHTKEEVRYHVNLLYISFQDKQKKIRQTQYGVHNYSFITKVHSAFVEAIIAFGR
jgi:imidazoleglycerol phosphate synthase glutamine amidotransferase subunit HisH